MKYGMLCFFLCTSFCLQAKVAHIQNSKQLKEIISTQPAVLKFSATWCGPCQMSKQPFEETSDKPEFSSVVFAEVDTDQQQSISNAYNIQVLPTFVFIRAESEVKRVEGLMNATNLTDFKRNLIQEINELVGQPKPDLAEPQEPAETSKDEPIEDVEEQETVSIKKEETIEQEDTTTSVFDHMYNWFNSVVDYISNLFR